MNLLSFLFVFTLFYALTPKVLISIPKKGSIMSRTLVHSLIFAVILQVTYHFFGSIFEGLDEKDKAANRSEDRDAANRPEDRDAENRPEEQDAENRPEDRREDRRKDRREDRRKDRREDRAAVINDKVNTATTNNIFAPTAMSSSSTLGGSTFTPSPTTTAAKTTTPMMTTISSKTTTPIMTTTSSKTTTPVSTTAVAPLPNPPNVSFTNITATLIGNTNNLTVTGNVQYTPDDGNWSWNMLTPNQVQYNGVATLNSGNPNPSNATGGQKSGPFKIISIGNTNINQTGELIGFGPVYNGTPAKSFWGDADTQFGYWLTSPNKYGSTIAFTPTLQ